MSRFVGSTRGRFATRRRTFPSLLYLFGIVVVAGCLALGCRIAPVVGDTRVGTGHYGDCEQAAQNYCELVVKASASDLEGCVAKYTFQCISRTSE